MTFFNEAEQSLNISRAALYIEEGTEIDTLKQIAKSMKMAAQEANVIIVCGDTKV